MKIYLLNPPYFPHFGREMRWQNTGRGGTLYYPIWLAYATALLKKAEFDVKLVDAIARNWDVEAVINDMALFSPEMVVIVTSFTSLTNDIKIAQQIKNKLNKLLVMVGPPTSHFSAKILDSGIDVVVRNEYDFTLVDLANHIQSGKPIGDVQGVSFVRDNVICDNPNRPWSTTNMLDNIPFVSETYKKHLNIRDYFLSYSLYPMVQIFGGRGCPYQCTFCSWPQSFTGKKYRIRNIANILDEIKWIENNLSFVKEVFFEDDTFTIDQQRVRQFCEQYCVRGLKLSWSCNARVGTLDLETMRAMKKANCRFVIVGFESANDDILLNIKKKITVSEARIFASNAKKSGLFLHADFIIGLPGETKATINNTWLFIKEIKPDQLQISVASPFPGTEFYDWAKTNGYLVTDNPNEYLDERGQQKSIITYPGLNNEEIVKEVDRILKGYYFSLTYVPIALRQVLNRNGWYEFKRLWYSVTAFIRYIYHR